LRSENRLRLARALNLGLDHALGEWVARMDADDISLPDRLSRQLDFLANHPEVGLCGGRVKHFGLFESHFYGQPQSYEDVRTSSLFYNPIWHPTVMMKRDLLERYNLRYDPALCPADDYDLWIRAMRHFPAMNMDRVLLLYRTHKGSLTSMEWTDMDAQSSSIAARELKFLGLDIDAETARFHRNIGRIGCMNICDIGDLQRAERWLHNLLAANNRVKYYPQEALRRAVGDVWYRVCYYASSLGFKTLKSYRQSTLRYPAPQGVKGNMALLKNALRVAASDLCTGRIFEKSDTCEEKREHSE